MEGRGDAEMEPWEIVDVVGSVLVVGGMLDLCIHRGSPPSACSGSLSHSQLSAQGASAPSQ